MRNQLSFLEIDVHRGEGNRDFRWSLETDAFEPDGYRRQAIEVHLRSTRAPLVRCTPTCLSGV